MSTIDIIILICFVPALVRGLRKGFTDQLISLVSIILGAWMSFKFANMVSVLLMGYFPNASERVLYVAAFVLILVVVILVLKLLGNLLEKLWKFAMLGWLDKLLGLALSLLKAAIVVGLVILLFDTVNEKLEIVKEDSLVESMFYGPLKDFAYVIFPYLKQLITKS